MSPFEASREEIDFELLSTYLRALSHPGRLEILSRLRTPATPVEVEMRPHRKDGLSPDRAVSRQTILSHLERLQEAGVVTRIPSEGNAADKWVTNVPQVFAVVEELRKLTAIPPSAILDDEETTATRESEPSTWVPGPKLVLLTGPWDGRIFRLDGAGPWGVGRSRSREVALTYDPFVSASHLVVERAGEAYALRAAPDTRNPTSVNLQPLAPGASRALAHGDIVGVGRSTLVFHAR